MQRPFLHPAIEDVTLGSDAGFMGRAAGGDLRAVRETTKKLESTGY